MMKQFLTGFIFIMLSTIGLAQDFDLYHRHKDDVVAIPKISNAMLFDEYQLLSRNIRMMDMAYAAIVPGYVHFKAKENKIGWWIVGVRSAAFGGLAYSLIRLSDEGEGLFSNLNQETSLQTKDAQNIGIASLTVVIGSYLFDWIYGKYTLEKKQEMIRYKYGFKLENDSRLNNEAVLNTKSPGAAYPSFYLHFKF
jgi:hypothetical protein